MVPTLEQALTVAALYPHPGRARMRDPGYCPLGCGFLLANDWDGHFVPCLVRRALDVWFREVT